jgi:hypothetical protein
MFGRFRAPAHQSSMTHASRAAGTVVSDKGLFPHGSAERISRYAEKRHRLAGKADADKRRAILEEMAEVVSLSQASRTKRPIERRTSTVSRSRYRFRALAYRREVLARRRLYPRPAATILAPFATWPPWFGCPLWRVRFPSIAPQTSDTRVPAPCRESSPPFALSQRDNSDNVPAREANSPTQ